MPRCRTMIVPACTAWPSPALMPSRCPTLSRPFLTEPPAFLCAIDRPRPYFCVFFGAAALVPAGFERAVGFFLSPVPVVSPLADRVDALGAAFVSVLALVDVLVEPFASAFAAFAAVALSVVALSAARVGARGPHW